MGPLRLEILGGFRLAAENGEAIDLPTRKAEALLGFLALPPGQAHRRDRLAALLWGDRGDKQARHSLNQTIFSIRKAVSGFAQDPIVARGESLALDPGVVQVDAYRFEELASTRGPGAVSQAAELYVGDLLSGLNLRADDFDDWLVAERIRLRELALGVLATFLDFQQTTGQTDAAIRTALRILALEPLQEPVHRTLMRLYADQNRVGAALRQYELCRTTLRRELNIAPEPETEALFRQLAEQRARVGGPARVAPGDGDDPDRNGLPTASPQGSAPGDPEDSFRSERKFLTVLGVEVVPTGPGDSDPESDLEMLGPALDALSETVDRYGGTVTHRQSHVVTALFGAPVTYEDHAVRACYAALDMRQSTGALTGDRAQLRIGLSSGAVVVRRDLRDGTLRLDAVGHAMNFAGQVRQSVAPGVVGIDAETRRLAEAFVEVEPLGDVSAAGAARPAGIFAVSRRKALVRPWQARLSRRLTEFVGRDNEMALLAGALERAGARNGQMIAIVGEPGVGKSRLVHEFVESPMTNGWKVLAAGAGALETNAAYGVVRQLLRAWLGVTARDAQADIVDRTRQSVLELDRSLEPALPVVFSLTDLPVDDEEWQALNASQRRRRILACIKALLSRLSEQQPLLLVLEDLHWIDSETQTVLDTMMEGLGGLRLLLLVTHRPEYRHDWTGRPGFSVVRLDALPQHSAERLLRNLLGDHPSIRQATAMLIDRTGGTPLFLEETVRALAESGVLVGTAGDYRLKDPIARVDIPTSVQAVLAARIDRLPPRAKSQLQAAAVVGMEVEDALLLKIAALPEEDHYDAIATLQAAGFLYETRQLPDIAYVFKHALTHDVAYNSMLREQKRALHVDVVRAIENVHGERLDEQVERLAFHAVCGGLAEEAIDYLYRAALRAIRHSAHEQAIAHINEGLGLLAPLSETGANLRKELDFRKALGVAMMAARGWGATEVSDAYTRAREICEKLGDDSGLFTALRGQGQFHMIRGELRTARQLGERCVTLAERSEDAGVRLETHHLFWSNSFFMGDYGNAAHHADAGIGQYDKGAHHHLTYVYSGHDPGVCCRAFSGLALWQQGYPERAAARCGEALALAQEVSHPLTLALAYWALSYLHLFRQEPGPAGEWAERGIAICNEYLMPLLLSQAQFQSGWAVARQGELSHGIARMEDGVRRIRETGSEMGLPYFVALLGEAYAAAGDAGLGLRRIDEALATAEQTGAYFGYPEMLRLRGELLLRCDGARLDEAETCLASAIEAARGQQAHMLELRAATSLARVLRERGRAAVARESLAPILGRFTEGLDMQDLLDAKVLLDELA